MAANKGGRPLKFEKINPSRVEYLVKKGFTKKEVAEFFGASVDALNRWLKKYPEMDAAFDDWKAVADDKVEQALFRKATGYQTTETKVFMSNGQPVTETVEKNYAPDTIAGIFWLKNRKPRHWRDRQEVAMDASENLQEVMEQISSGKSAVDIAKERKKD